MSKKLLIFFGIIIILAIGSWLRFSGILSNSFAFTYDVGRDMLAVRAIVVDHKISLIGQTTGIEGVFYGPWWHLTLSIPFFFFSGNPQGIAFFMGLIGIVTILMSFFVGKKIGGVFLGIVFSAFTSISPLMVSSSSQIWNPNLIPFFSVLVIIFLYKVFFDAKHEIYKLKNFLILGLLSGFIIDMEIVFGFLFLPSICVSLALIFGRKLKLKEIFFFTLGLMIIFSPRIVFEFRHNFLMTKRAFSFFNNEFFSSTSISFFDVFFNRLVTLFNLWSDTLAGKNNIVGLTLIIFIFFNLLFFYRKIDGIQKQFIKTILVIVGIFLIGLTFFGQNIWPHYLVGLPIFYILLLSLCINITGNILKNYWITFVILIVLLWINLDPIRVLDDMKKPIWEGNAAVYRNQIAVVDYVYENAKGKNFKYIVYTPAVHDYNYRYLFSWYGKNKYGYSPLEINSDLFYVILEPDYDLPFRLKDWLELRKGDGVVEKEKIVKGGVVVQTRIRKQ